MFDQQAQILDGVYPSELGLVSDIETDGKIEDSDLEAIIPFYKDTFLPTKLKSMMQTIDSDEEAKKAYRYLSFTEGVINGRNVIVEPEADAKRRNKAKHAANNSMTNMAMASKAAQKMSFNNYVKDISKKSH